MYDHQCTFNLTLSSQDREARLDLMRKRARERDGDFDGEVEEPATKKKPRLSPDAPLMTERGHINFFADIKQGVGYCQNMASSILRLGEAWDGRGVQMYIYRLVTRHCTLLKQTMYYRYMYFD